MKRFLQQGLCKLGDWDEEEKPKKPMKKACEEPVEGENMRSLYWAVVHEEQKRLRKAHPEMRASEVLKMARASWFGCT